MTGTKTLGPASAHAGRAGSIPLPPGYAESVEYLQLDGTTVLV
jgi:hypothetical protein